MMYRYLLAPFIFHFYDAGNMHASYVLLRVKGCLFAKNAAEAAKRFGALKLINT